MEKEHEAYPALKSWMLEDYQWEELILLVEKNNKKLMLLLNDTKAIEFASNYSPSYVELHSVCMNVPNLQKSINLNIAKSIPIVLGVGGCSLEEIDASVQAFNGREVIIMFGFQNYPTKYQDVNLNKIRRMQKIYNNIKFGYADHTAWDENNNELITMLVSANNMNFVEKHVTTLYGQERCDYSAAISVSMFNSIAENIKILNEINGNGLVALNNAEKSYSQYGPMKMAAIINKNIAKGEILSEDNVSFTRIKQNSSLSQIEAVDMFGKVVTRDIAKNELLGKEMVA